MTRSPRTILPEVPLPWTLPKITRLTPVVPERVLVVPERDDLGYGFVCVRAAVASISRVAGTSVIARLPNVSGRFVAGRRPNGKPGGDVTPLPKPGTPRRNGRAVSEPKPRHNHRRTPSLRRSVVTQRTVFFAAIVRAAGVPRVASEFDPQPGSVLLRDLSPGRSQCFGSRTQVAVSWHVEWPAEASLRVPGHPGTTRSAARQRRECVRIAAASPVMIFASRAGRHLSRCPEDCR